MKLNVDLFTSTVVVELVYVAVHFIMMIPVAPGTLANFIRSILGMAP